MTEQGQIKAFKPDVDSHILWYLLIELEVVMFVNVAVAILFVSLSYHHGLGEYIIKAYDLYLNKTVSNVSLNY